MGQNEERRQYGQSGQRVFFIIAGALFPSGGFLYTLMLATLVYLMGLATIGTINLTQKNQKTITLKVKK
jgi:hypothetical protein